MSEAARELVGRDFDQLISSDLQRAAQSAALLGDVLGLRPEFDDQLREMDVGEWSGLPHDEIASRWPEPLAAYRAGDRDVRLGGAESQEMLEARVRPALGRFALAYSGKSVLIVAHGGVIRAIVPGVFLGNAETLEVRMDRTCAEAWSSGDFAPGPLVTRALRAQHDEPL